MKKALPILIIALLASCTQQDLNLLIIHTDQQSQWTIGAYGMDELRGPLTTPNLDELARDGILFTNFFTNSAVCSPSRALMMTGCYATRNGVYTNNMVMEHIPTLASQLAEAGYVTGYAGKWHLSGTAKPGWAPESYGWEDNRFMFNRGHYKMITEEEDGRLKAHPYGEIGEEKSYTTDWLTDKTIEFIAEHQNEKFAYMVSYPDPHQPWEVREPYNSMYTPKDMSVPESFIHHENPVNSWHDSLIQKHYSNLNPDRIKNIKSMYSGSVNLIDYNVGRLLKELKDLDLYDNTLIVFTSDHGEYMGEHGMLYKNHTAHVHHALHTGVGVFTPEYYLVLHQSGEHLLFDRINDPGEMNNLYNDPKHQNMVEVMTEKIKEHHKMYGTPEYDWIRRIVD